MLFFRFVICHILTLLLTASTHFTPCRVTDREMPGYGDPPSSLWRRYNEFELLRTYLEVMYPATVVPPLPEKRVRHVREVVHLFSQTPQPPELSDLVRLLQQRLRHGSSTQVLQGRRQVQGCQDTDNNRDCQTPTS